ncbi:thiamine/thiamine pyrophosphate ABC transporter permease ThiP [Brucella tritici]|uniref:Thiamine transport system permease protein ThiP n=1 Tax=Brucella tritici TaxID=94626 RepID=A0A6L3YKA8_9HYPH|nr:thiamine/thiamine pyrophosphate ABC transporter permease ThiP [Brucella tritici]KAB2676404.1 thiamine/thiamine pyrophosphate ABC transporter permease ThiP [Brucella tritici]KAB2683212.1 thiamine/thiamine pyrophosphate ABC transporter permease ThiP [Brucella tritici]
MTTFPAQHRSKNISAAKPAAGALALVFLIVLAGGALVALAFEAGSGGFDAAANFDAYLWRVARFTILQAIASSLISVLFAVPVARALYAEVNFPGRALILRLFALPLALPALVAVLGVTSIYGRNGFIAHLSEAAGHPFQPDIYGITGILIAHIFFNMPLAVRLILAGYESIPTDYWKLAAQLGMGNGARFRLIEWPVIRRNLPGMIGLIFMLCVTSFTTVLTLGGGPRATTLEVAIYQSLHFDFDPGRAVALTFTQLALTLLVLLALRMTGSPSEEGFTHAATPRRYSRASTAERILNIVIIGMGFLYVALPIAGVVISGLAADLGRLLTERTVWRAIGTSLALGFCAALLSVILSLALVSAREAMKKRKVASIFDTGASLILVMPPIVIGAGWFILLRHFTDPFAMAPFMVVTVNAAMAMPFAVRLLRPAWDTAASRHNRLCAQLGIRGFNRLRVIDWPSIRKPFGMAFAFAMALSLGDLGTIALFGSDALLTLPYLLLQRMGSYRTFDAAGLALILGLLCLVLMMIADRASRKETPSP